MRKPESTWGKVGLATAVAAGAGAIVLFTTSDDEPKITEHFVDCAVHPHGTASKTVHPGEAGQANLGEAYEGKDGRTVWRSLFEVHYELEQFTVVAGGFSPPGGEIRYNEIPQGDYTTGSLVEDTKYSGYIEASVIDFDASDPLNPKNAATITFHCGAPPKLPQEPGPGPETSTSRPPVL